MARYLLCMLVLAGCSTARGAEPLRVGKFQADVTPPLGAPLCDGLVPPASEIVDRLSARGIVLLSEEQPVVLCAVDWVGIGNAGHLAWRTALAKAAGTTPERVAVHCLHQHDAPGCDFATEELLALQGLGGQTCDVLFAREAIERTSAAVHQAAVQAEPVTHVGFGSGIVEQVASNRRILGADGKVAYVRFSSCRTPEAIAAPEGLIDPLVRLVSFWNGDRPLVAMTYYATHPQSYYGQGGVSADFVGMARALREAAAPEMLHVHFNGAGGNVAAGKYNDGSPANRPLLAQRLADGMQLAWTNTQKQPVGGSDLHWRTQAVQLPASPRLVEVELRKVLEDPSQAARERIRAARDLIWLRSSTSGPAIDLALLRIGGGYIVHMPGELFIEYQIASQALRPDAFVAMAAYGDYGPGYIGTEVSYTQGGYETGPVSRVAPQVEGVLLDGLRALFK